MRARDLVAAQRGRVMKNTFRLSMTWLHTWSGLLLGWVLFAIFVTGTATYFKWEITRWMQPELSCAVSSEGAARAALRSLEKLAADSPRWLIDLPDARTPATTAYWQGGEGRRFSTATLDGVTGEKVTARESRGGEFFYRFHFQLQLPHPWGRYLAGVAAMFMFVALISGVITHRQFFKEFFTFRPGRATLRSFLDFHNVTAVLALPFYFMISYSALVIFMSMYMPWGRMALMDPQSAGQSAAVKTNAAAEKKTDATWVAPASFDAMLADVTENWARSGPGVKRIEVTGRGTERAVVTFTRGTGRAVSTATPEQLRFNGVTGERLPDQVKPGGAGTAINGVFYGLHMARFAGPGLRWMFFLMGLFGSALVATGLVMWTLKRRAKAAKAGGRQIAHALVERLNIAAIAGLFVAIAALFWANRLLPVGLAQRGDWEVRIFLITWGVLLLHTFVRPVMRGWREQLWIGAGLWCALPVLDGCTGPFLKQAISRGDAAYLGFHAVVIFTGALLAFAAVRISRRSAAASVAPVVAEKETVDANNVEALNR
jgi:uncharacterized iron-regulated membrane protein